MVYVLEISVNENLLFTLHKKLILIQILFYLSVFMGFINKLNFKYLFINMRTNRPVRRQG